jgi:YidC/Oxa1 family membrane protein insertase
LNLSRALDADEVRWLRDAAQARADKKNEDALRMLERAAARMPAPEAEEETPRADAAGDGDTLDAAAGETKTSRGKAPPLTVSASAHPTVLYALAQTRMVLKLWKDAANAYELSAKMEVNAERRAMAFAGAGVARANVGDLAAAATALDAAIALNDKDVSSMISLAAVRKRSGDLKGAFEVLERAAKIAPEVRERFIAPLEKETARGGKKGGNPRASSGGHKVKGAGREKNAHEGGRNGGRGDNDRRT